MFDSYKKITLDDMMKYIDEKAPEDKAWFKKEAFKDKEGNETDSYQHLTAVRAFCGKYMPELLPVAKPKPISGKEKLKGW